jgi:hypothetical protein
MLSHQLRSLVGALAIMLALSPLMAYSLELPSSEELVERCRSYAADPDGRDGTFCIAYVQGFIDASPLVAIRHDDKVAESFTQRAARTRLGRPVSSRPKYCIDSVTRLDDMISQILDQAVVTPPRDDTDASVLLYATFARFHACPSR